MILYLVPYVLTCSQQQAHFHLSMVKKILAISVHKEYLMLCEIHAYLLCHPLLEKAVGILGRHF